MQINPAHFWGSSGSTEWTTSQSCAAVWPQHAWQHGDQVSRYDVALAIQKAEEEISNYVGYYPAPKYVCQEIRPYPSFYRPGWGGGISNISGLGKGVKARWGKLFDVGVRAVDILGNATVGGGTLVYSDESGLGAIDTATITITLTSEQLAVLNVCEAKLYYTDEGGAQEWEIREARKTTLSGNVLTIVIDAWLMIDPNIWSRPPNTEDDRFRAVSLDNANSMIQSVDVYREYTDKTVPHSQLIWENYSEGASIFCTSCGGSGCTACALTIQDGCLHWRDTEMTYLVPTPATYNEDTASWGTDSLSVCRAPDRIKMWYKAGDASDRYKCGETCDPMPEDWKKVIAYLATSRLEREFCDCSNISSVAANLQTNIAFSGDDTSFLVDFAMLANPFGTRIGEKMAWDYVRAFGKKQYEGFAI